MKKIILIIVFQIILGYLLFSQSSNALSFLGDDDYVVLDALAQPISQTTDFTVEFWMKSDLNNNTSSPRVALFAINPDAQSFPENKFLIVMGGSNSQTGNVSILEDVGGGGGIELASTTVVGDGACHHIAYVKSGSTGELYIDGVLEGTHTANFSVTGTDRFSLGQEWDYANPSDFYNGEMDELRVWAVARTSAQIQSTMNTGLTGMEAGLLAYYDFNQGIPGGNNGSEIVLKDKTANNINGHLNGFALTGNSSNWITESCLTSHKNALSFLGDDDYVVLDALAQPISQTTDFTVEFWMKSDLNNNTSSPRVALFAINPDAQSSPENKFLIVMGGSNSQTGNVLILEDVGGGGGIELASTTVVGDGTCHHIAYVKSGSTGELYIDGVLEGTHTANFSVTGTDRFSLGQEWDYANPSDFYNGEMDELRVWTVARTAAQIQSTMNIELTGTEAGFLAYYDFNQGIPGGNNLSINVLKDKTVNSLDGQLYGFALNGSSSNWITESCDIISGTKEFVKIDNKRFDLYPDPARDIFFIRSKEMAEISEVIKLEIIDMNGRVIQTNYSVSSSEININSLKPGFYLVAIYLKNGINISKLTKI